MPDTNTYINKYNESVRENRIMVKHLINMIIFLSTQEMAFRGNDGTSGSDNQVNFKQLANFLKRIRNEDHYFQRYILMLKRLLL